MEESASSEKQADRYMTFEHHRRESPPAASARLKYFMRKVKNMYIYICSLNIKHKGFSAMFLVRLVYDSGLRFVCA